MICSPEYVRPSFPKPGSSRDTAAVLRASCNRESSVRSEIHTGFLLYVGVVR
jgi:hypothetical protein